MKGSGGDWKRDVQQRAWESLVSYFSTSSSSEFCQMEQLLLKCNKVCWLIHNYELLESGYNVGG